MNLFARMQEIFGAKTFRDKATFDGLVTFNGGVLAKKGVTMSGNTYVQPVAGEPSMGTLHHLPLTNTTDRNLVNGVAVPAAGNWSAAVDCSADVPVGAKAILVDVIPAAVSNGQVVLAIAFSDNTASTPTINTAHPYCNLTQYGGAGESIAHNRELVVPLSSSRTFYWYVITRQGGSSYALTVTAKGYFI